MYVEIDGNHYCDLLSKSDNYRTMKLEKYGNKLLRFTNQEVIENVNKVINKIKEFNLWHPIRSRVIVKHPKEDSIIKAPLLNNYREYYPNQI